MAGAERRTALEDLVLLRRPVAEAARRVRSFGWDSDFGYVILSRRDVDRVLDAFLRDQLDATSVEAWADAIESREDIAFESGFEDALKDLIFTMANPTLNGPISADAARLWKAGLQT
jgi:hypothetical protein